MPQEVRPVGVEIVLSTQRSTRIDGICGQKFRGLAHSSPRLPILKVLSYLAVIFRLEK